MTDTNDLIRRADAIAAIPTGWLGQPHYSNMDYGPNVSVQAIASIRALPAQEPRSPDVTAGTTMDDLLRAAEHEILHLPPAVSHLSPGRKIDRKAALAVVIQLRNALQSRPATPAPVVPAEGLDDIAGALARGYCAPENSHKELDADLINAMMREVAALRSAPSVGADMGNPITMIYRNYRGEVSERTVIPRRIWWGSTDWHPEPGWLMSAYDPDKAADRDFALADCDFRRIAPPVGARVTGWQPIETAPKDWVTEVLMYDPDLGMAVWPPTNSLWPNVTHWMPLPEPPAALLPAGEGE